LKVRRRRAGQSAGSLSRRRATFTEQSEEELGVDAVRTPADEPTEVAVGERTRFVSIFFKLPP
jgi:hypothetical protein